MLHRIKHFVKLGQRWIARENALADFAKLHPDATFGEGVLLYGTNRIRAGTGLFIDRRAYLNCGSLNGGRGFIEMGNNVEIGPYVVLWGAGGIRIGNNVHIGSHVSITAHEARQIRPDETADRIPLTFDFSEVIIEDCVLVCSGTNIVPGVRIGHHSMIGGGSVVVNDIPPYSLAVGSPARVIKTLVPENASELLQSH